MKEDISTMRPLSSKLPLLTPPVLEKTLPKRRSAYLRSRTLTSMSIYERPTSVDQQEQSNALVDQPNQTPSQSAYSPTGSQSPPPIEQRPSTSNILSNRLTVCNRSKSAIERNVIGMHIQLSRDSIKDSRCRQSCDVLGPSACYECRQVIGRAEQTNTGQNFEKKYPNMYMTEVNLSAAILARRSMPQLSEFEIQQSVARGDICPQVGFKAQAERIKSAGENRSKESRDSSMVIQKKSDYFTCIDDLNTTLNNGPKNEKYLKAVARLKEQEKGSEKLRPKFISPRRSKAMSEPKRERYVAPFDPPLLPKVCQNVEAGFFAGN